MNLTRWSRRHVTGVTLVLSVVALAFVFGAALQRLPVEALPRSPPLLTWIPHINSIVSLAAIGTITVGWRAARSGAIDRHRVSMLASFVLFATFLVLYLYRVALLGPTEFPGTPFVHTYVYLPILVVHVLLAIVCVPFVINALLLAATHSISELPETNHPMVGRIAASLWLISFTLGIVIYAMLYLVY